MISRCSVALATVAPERNYSLKTKIEESLHGTPLFLGEEPDHESSIRQLLHLAASGDTEQHEIQ